VDLDSLLAVPIEVRDQQPIPVAVSEELRQADAVVGGTGLLAERDDSPAACRIEPDQPLAEAVADHAVADDDDGFPLLCHAALKSSASPR